MPSHCDPSTPVAGQLRATPFPCFGYWQRCSGSRRGVCLAFGPLSVAPFPRVKPTDQTFTAPVIRSQVGGDTDSGLFVSYLGSFTANLLNDGWDIFNVAYPEVGAGATLSPANIPAIALQNEVNSDPANGARYLSEVQRSVEHCVLGIEALYGSGVPIILSGGSHGGWASLVAAAYLGNRINGFFVDVPATTWEVASTFFTTPADFNTTNFSGMDLPTTYLNGIPASLPGLITYGTSDDVLGWSQTTVASVSVGVNVTTLTGSASVSVTDATQLNVFNSGGHSGPCVTVPTNSAAGFATINFTAFNGNVLTGCNTTYGTGTIQSGAVIQNTVNQMITTAQGAGKNIVRNATADNHDIGFLTAGSYFPLSGPTALSSLGTLTLAANVDGAGFTTGQVQIRDTTNVWHTVNFTGTSTTTVSGATVGTLTGCTYSGNTAATVALGSAIVATGSPQAMLWWLSQNVDTGLGLTWSY